MVRPSADAADAYARYALRHYGADITPPIARRMAPLAYTRLCCRAMMPCRHATSPQHHHLPSLIAFHSSIHRPLFVIISFLMQAARSAAMRHAASALFARVMMSAVMIRLCADAAAAVLLSYARRESRYVVESHRVAASRRASAAAFDDAGAADAHVDCLDILPPVCHAGLLIRLISLALLPRCYATSCLLSLRHALMPLRDFLMCSTPPLAFTLPTYLRFVDYALIYDMIMTHNICEKRCAARYARMV